MEFSCLGFRVLAPGNMDAEQLDSTLCNLYSLSHRQEIKLLSELQNCFKTFMRYRHYFSYISHICCLNGCIVLFSVSSSTFSESCDEVNLELCQQLKKSIREYFTIDHSSLIFEKQVCYLI